MTFAKMPRKLHTREYEFPIFWKKFRASNCATELAKLPTTPPGRQSDAEDSALPPIGVVVIIPSAAEFAELLFVALQGLV